MTDRYRKKPVEVLAWKIGFDGQEPDWVREAFDGKHIDWCPAGEGIYINTLEGRMKANIGDMLIEGVKGELYGCRADIFAATYEPVETTLAAEQQPTEGEETDRYENMINDGCPERIWIESDGGCPYFYLEEELADVSPPFTDYVRADKLEELAAENEALRAEVERLHRILGRIVEGDGDSTLTIRAGADAFAAAREYLVAQLEDTKGARLPTWQDMLGDAEQFVRQKPTFSKYRGTVLENDVPVWIADFAQRLLLRELTRLALHVRAAALEEAARVTGEFAQKWRAMRCASKKHMETTRRAHDDFCALQAAIRAMKENGNEGEQQ